MNNDIMVSVVIVSAGSFTRMNGVNKQLAEICGIPVIVRSASAFEPVQEVAEIVIAARAEDVSIIRDLCGKYGIKKLTNVVCGGADRKLSVQAGLAAVSANAQYIAVHDGARPNVTPKLISDVISDARTYGAAVLAVPVKETIKVVRNGIITETPPRNLLYTAQTPQVFKKEIYVKALENYGGNNLTDDAMLVEAAGCEVKITAGSYDNIKITTAADLKTAEAIIKKSTSFSCPPPHTPYPLVGHGYDVHRLVKGRELILGGVKIAHEYGLLGHSDADVLAHAVTDAVLGATALGDIGCLFPDTDDKYKNADSLKLLSSVIDIVTEKGYSILNLDATIIAEKPKLAEYIPEMRKNISRVCKLPINRINVKATTEEGLGLGGEGIGAHCICIVGEE